MASKDKLRTSKFEMDPELDFDFDIGDIDRQMNPDLKKGGKNRNPLTDAFKGTIAGAKNEATSRSFIAKRLREALPESYGEIADAASKARQSTSQLYDEAVREIKPQLGALSKRVDRLVPEENKRLKKLTSKFKQMFDDGATSGPSKEQAMEQSITMALGQVFTAQQEVQNGITARQAAEGKIKDRVEGKRFEGTYSLLSAINENTFRAAQYTERVNQAYQKKSLELQYRSYFVQNELLRMTSKFYEVFKNQNEAIVKNTGLPDYVKITNTERLLQTTKNKFAERANNLFFGPDSAIGRGIQRIGEQAKEYLQGIKQGLESGLMGVDMMADASDTLGDVGISKSQMIYGMGGAQIANYVGGKIARKTRGFIDQSPRAKKLRDGLNEGSNFVNNVPGKFKTWQKSKWMKEGMERQDPVSFLFKALNWGMGNFLDQAPDMSITNPNSMNALGLGGKFDNRTQRSIVDVIPGYLSRILREVTVLRTGDEKGTQALLYDFTNGKFATKNEVYQSMNKAFSKKAQTSMQGFTLDQLSSEIMGGKKMDSKLEGEVKKFFDATIKDTSLKQTPAELLASKQFKKLKPDVAAAVKASLTGSAAGSDTTREIKHFILSISKIPNFEYTPENIRQLDSYTGLSAPAKVAVDRYFSKNFDKSDNRSGNQLNLTKKMGSIRGNTADIRFQIEQFINSGYSEILTEKGVIKVNDEGNFDIDIPKYHKFIDTEMVEGRETTSDRNAKRNIKPLKGGMVESDVTSKRDISPLNPRNALAAIKKTKIYNWLYKSGKGEDDGEYRNGPMAQDVNKNMGEDAAPGGTKLDLTTMNGNNMAAIQELAKRQDKLMGSDKGAVAVLKGIRKDTSQLVKIAKGSMGKGKGQGGQGSAEVDNSYTGILGRMFGGLGTIAGKGAGDLFTAAGKVAKGAGTAVGYGADVLGKGYDKIKDPAANAVQFVLRKAGELSMRALDVGQDLIFNKLPQGLKQAKDLGMWAKDKLVRLVSQAKDVYVKGSQSPAIRAYFLKAGHYKDQVTGKILYTMADLQTLKGNVINAAGEVVLTIEDAAKGLYDSKGEKIKTGLQRAIGFGKEALMNGLGRAKNFLGGVLTKGSEFFGKLGGKFGNFDFGGFGFGNDRIYKVLVEMRDMMRRGSSMSGSKSWSDSGDMPEQTESEDSSTGSLGDFIGPLVQSTTGKIKDAVKTNSRKAKTQGKRVGRKAAKKAQQAAGKAAMKARETAELAKARFDSKKGGIKSFFSNLFGKSEDKTTFNDRDGSGKRDGDASDRFAKQAEREKANKKGDLKMDTSAKYRSSENVIDMMMDKAGKLFDMAKGGLGDVFDKTGDMMDTAGDLLGTGKGKKGGLLSKIGKVFTSPFSMAWKATKGVGKAAWWATKGIGKGAMWAARNPVATLRGARTAMTVASLMTGGVGSAVLGGLTAGLSAIGGVIFSAPVLGALAIAGVAYGAKKLYDHYNRDNATELGKVRLLQYGLLEKDERYNHTVLTLEAYLLDGRIGYSGGKAYTLDKKIDIKEMISIFSIDENNEEACKNFGVWYAKRFKPFFLTHLTAALQIDKKISFDNIEKFKPDQKIKYLALTSFDGGPYDEDTSPYQNLEQLPNTKEKTLDYIKYLNQKFSEMLKGKEKKLPTAAPDAAKTKQPAPAALPGKDMPKPETKTAKPMTTGPTGEDGAAPKVVGNAGRGTGGASLPKLYVASGAMRDGSGADQYMKLQPGVTLDGLNPSMLRNFRAMVQEYGEATGKSVTITSGVRTAAEQEALRRSLPKGRAAAPGNSSHEFGLALDVSQHDLDAMEEAGLMRKYGFTRPVGGEPWHMEAAGIQTNIQLAKKDSTFATQAIEASLFKGGGGAGITPGVPQYRRDMDIAMAALNGHGEQKVKGSDKDGVMAALTAKPANEPMSQLKTGGSFEQGKTYSKVSRLPVMSGTRGTMTPDVEGKPVERPMASSEPINTNSREDVKNAVMTIASNSGADGKEAALIAAVESSMNPNARATATDASGLFQFKSDTWNEQMGKHARRLGIAPGTQPTDVKASTLLAVEYIKSNKRSISSVKPNPTITDAYLTHFLGAAGARKFLSADPNAIAATIRPDAAKSNPEIFYENGRALTVAQVYSKINAKLVKAGRDYGIDVQSSPDLQAKQTTAQSGTVDQVASATTAMSNRNTAPAPTTRRILAPAVPVTVMSQPSSNTLPQQGFSSAVDMGATNGILTKQLDVQTEMRDILRELASKMDPEKFAETIKSVSAQASAKASPQGKPAQVIKPAIDMSRKVA